jgi:hypothetical protein
MHDMTSHNSRATAATTWLMTLLPVLQAAPSQHRLWRWQRARQPLGEGLAHPADLQQRPCRRRRQRRPAAGLRRRRGRPQQPQPHQHPASRWSALPVLGHPPAQRRQPQAWRQPRRRLPVKPPRQQSGATVHGRFPTRRPGPGGPGRRLPAPACWRAGCGGGGCQGRGGGCSGCTQRCAGAGAATAWALGCRACAGEGSAHVGSCGPAPAAARRGGCGCRDGRAAL